MDPRTAKSVTIGDFCYWTIQHFWSFFRYYLVAILSLVILHYCLSLLPEYAKSIVSLSELSREQVYKLLLSVVVLVFAILLSRTASRWYFFYPARIIQKNMRLQLMRQLSFINYKGIEKFTKGTLYQYLINDCDLIRAYLGFALLQIFNVVVALAILIPKINKDYSYLTVTLTPLFLGLVVMVIITWFTQGWYRLGLKAQENLQDFIIDSYRGKRDIKSIQKEEMFDLIFQQRSRKESQLFYQASVIRSMVRPLITLSAGISFVWSSFLIWQYGSVADIIAFTTFIYLLLDPLMFLTWIGIVAANGYASWSRIKSFEKEMDVLKSQEVDFIITEPNLIANLDQLILKSQNKAFQKVIGICGPTGVGKSVFLKELCLRLQQHNIIASVVIQSPNLFDDALFSNLCLGQDISKNKARSLISLFRIEDLGLTVDEVLSLSVEDEGRNLSGGQRKRVALIRSLLCDARYLLWDDPFSSVDIHSELKIWNQLFTQGYFKNRILLFSSHRLSTMNQAEEIWFMQERNKVSFFTGDLNTKVNIEQIPTLKKFFQRQLQ